ncbi:MAG: ArnT family glycosyltransferase, partial [Anaerolineales bacterium]
MTWAGALALWWRFDGLYGQDPFAYFDYATGPARASLIRLGFLPSFYWPPGYPVLVAFASFVLGPIPLAGQLVSLLAGGATAVFTGLLAREVWQPNAGHASSVTCFLLAGLLVALNAQLVQSSVVVMSDATGLAAATLGVWALARYGRVGKAGWLWLASGALAWAIVTRWIYGLVAVPCAAYVLWVLLRRARACQKLLALRHGLGAALVSGLILLPVIIPALTSLVRSTGPAPFAVDLEVYRWNPLNAFQREFVTADGHLSYAWPNGLYYALAPAHIYYFTPLLALFIVLGVWAVWQRRSIEWWLLIVGWAAMVYAFHAGAAWQNFRFTLAYLPPLAVLAAAGLVEMQQRLRPRYA